ncbi:MAG: asparagine synthase-related protein, partial [Clostridia bacterium]|nr:asparagine synthase-related protein [Clostridia bacterium]
MNLQEFFAQYPKVAIAFSGGVDSAYLLYAAVQYAEKARAYYVKSQFQPQFELDDALRLAEELGADLQVLHLDVLSVPCVAQNPPDRCYYCKKAIFGAISAAAASDGFSVLLDGTNASDDAGDR